MGCFCGKPSPIEVSKESPSQLAASPPPSQQATLSGKRAAGSWVGAGVRKWSEGAPPPAAAAAAVEKRQGGGIIKAHKQDAEWKLEKNQGYQAHSARAVTGFPKAMEGEQAAAGWPPWLASVAGEAIWGWVPRRADSFEKLDKIGQGTYSNVYKAHDLDNEKIVALKKVRFDNLEPESVKFMAREILILRRLNHQNVIKLEGLVTSQKSSSLYLVFEYMEHDLAGLASIPGVKFTEPQVKCYMQQLLRGLDHCHSRGVLHRDIKGSNLLIDENGILKIADFGLASFFDPDQKIPLTSRVVTLWYRPPELLLGANYYGVAVDLWSSGCILAELYAGKPIMPGRTEVEQLHKIFKLCGSPSDEYWRKSKLPHATIFKPQQPYKRCVAETFKDFPPSALAFLDILLSVDPADRGTTSSALKSEFFMTKPLPCDPSSLPKYPPTKEFDAKRLDEEARRKGAPGRKIHKVDIEKRGQKESRAIPAADANAELLSSMQKWQGHANSKTRSETFNPHQEEVASGFPIEPSRVDQVLEVGQDSQNYHPQRASRSGPLVHRSQLPKSRKPEDDKSKVSLAVNTSAIPGMLAGTMARKKILTDNGSESFGTQLGGDVQVHNLPESGNELSNGRKYVQAYDQRDCARSSNADQPIQQNSESKGNRIQYSGPLLRNSGNVDQVLKDYDRKIQEVFRRARHDKSKALRTHGDGNQIGRKLGFPIYPSSRDSSTSVLPSDIRSLQENYASMQHE